MSLEEILARPEGPETTAALVAWIQALYEDDDSKPVLVGGAAVELFTGGAYTTGDLDFAGDLPPTVKSRLRDAGFERRGRHWVHTRGRIFIEFPSSELGPGEESVDLDVAGWRLRVLAPEAVLVDRLAAWELWDSSSDAVNAFLVWRALGDQLDWDTVQSLAERREILGALARLEKLVGRFAGSEEPTEEELTRWAERDDS